MSILKWVGTIAAIWGAASILTAIAWAAFGRVAFRDSADETTSDELAARRKS